MAYLSRQKAMTIEVKTPSSAETEQLARKVIDAFYDCVVRWTRGREQREALLEVWESLVDIENFSIVDASGKLWPAHEEAMSSYVYGSGSSWLSDELNVQNFAVLRQDFDLCLVSFELWEQVCRTQDSTSEEITARRVTAWLKRLSNSSIVLLHIQETWIEGNLPRSIKQEHTQPQQKQSIVPSDGTLSKQESWKKTNVPSRRRHISPRLEEFHAKPLFFENQVIGVSVKGWDIGTSQGPIGDSVWFTKASDELEQAAQYKLPKSSQHRKIVLPEMVFPVAHVAIERAKGDLFLSWDVMDALKEWSEAHQAIPLNKSDFAFRGVSVLQSSDAKLWENKKGIHDKPASSKDGDAVFHYDWTYSTPFSGKVYGSAGSVGWKKLRKSGMPMEMLKDQSVPILLFDDILLLQDDLHDNGDVQLSAKVRVMPSCAYVLSKLFLRIDGVLLRLRECRLLVDFAAEKLYRDVTWVSFVALQQPNH